MTASTMLPLGTIAPEFSLPDTRGNRVALDDFPQARRISWPSSAITAPT